MAVCTKADFTTWQKVYESGTGESGFLDDYGKETGRKWRLTIDRANPRSAVNYGKTAGKRPYSEVIAGWKKGFEIDWPYCDKDKNFYKVEWPAVLKDITPTPPPCKLADFRKGRKVYESGDGYSGFLDRYGKETGRKWKLTIDRDNPSEAFKDKQIAGSRTYSSVIKGWKDGYEIDWVFCSSDAFYYRVEWPAKLEEIVVTPPKPVYKVLPEPPKTIHGEGIAWYKKFDEALYNRNAAEIIKLMKEAIFIPQSPMPLLALVFGIAGVVGTITAILGSYPFAGFLREEAIQTIDIGIMTATKNKDAAGLENLIKIKEEILERTFWEKAIGAIPILTVVASLKDYWTATRAKLAVDKSTLAALQIEAGVKKLPEKITANVRDIVDGDTIEVALTAKDEATGNDVVLPQYGMTGHASVRILGINSPEKSPKGEIVCTGIEVYKVAPKYADLSRQALLYLNEKNVTLKIDPARTTDIYGRLLAVVVYAGQDIGLEQIREGLACYYAPEPNKYVDDEAYMEASLRAKSENIGMWSEVLLPVPEVVPGVPAVPAVPPTAIAFSIDSTPSGAKVFIDEIYTKHLTPTNEVEQKKEIALWTEGKHKLRLIKAGYSAEGTIELVRGVPLVLNWELTGMAKPPVVVPPEVIPPEVIPPEVKPPAVIVPTTQQELFDLLKTYYVGRLYLGKKELAELEKLEPEMPDDVKTLFADVKAHYVGLAYMTKKELAALGVKYGLSVAGLE